MDDLSKSEASRLGLGLLDKTVRIFAAGRRRSRAEANLCWNRIAQRARTDASISCEKCALRLHHVPRQDARMAHVSTLSSAGDHAGDFEARGVCAGRGRWSPRSRDANLGRRRRRLRRSIPRRARNTDWSPKVNSHSVERCADGGFLAANLLQQEMHEGADGRMRR